MLFIKYSVIPQGYYHDTMLLCFIFTRVVLFTHTRIKLVVRAFHLSEWKSIFYTTFYNNRQKLTLVRILSYLPIIHNITQLDSNYLWKSKTRAFVTMIAIKDIVSNFRNMIQKLNIFIVYINHFALFSYST